MSTAAPAPDEWKAAEWIEEKNAVKQSFDNAWNKVRELEIEGVLLLEQRAATGAITEGEGDLLGRLRRARLHLAAERVAAEALLAEVASQR